MLLNCKNEKIGKIVNSLLNLEFIEFTNHILNIPYTARKKPLENFEYDFLACCFIDDELESLVMDLRENNI